MSQIRGAPAIASLAALSVASHLSIALETSPPPEFLTSPEALKNYVQPILDYLYTARPTAVNLGAATRRLTKTLHAGVDAGRDAVSIARDLAAEGKAIDDEDVSRNRLMSKWGAEWLLKEVEKKGKPAEGLQVMTVCNTGSLATSVSDYGVTYSLFYPTVVSGLWNRIGSYHPST